MADDRMFLECRVCKEAFGIAKCFLSAGWYTNRRDNYTLDGWFKKHKECWPYLEEPCVGSSQQYILKYEYEEETMAYVLPEEVDDFFPPTIVFSDHTILKRFEILQTETHFLIDYRGYTNKRPRYATFHVPRLCSARVFPWDAEFWQDEIRQAEILDQQKYEEEEC